MRKTPVYLNSLLVCLLGFTAIACGSSYTMLTSRDLEQRGTRSFAESSLADATTGVDRALKLQGYEVVQSEPESGIIRTAPKDVFAEASTATTGQANHGRGLAGDRTDFDAKSTTTVQRDGLAWSVSVKEVPEGVRVRMMPSAFRNGVRMNDDEAFAAEVMDPHYQSLWREIEAQLQ